MPGTIKLPGIGEVKTKYVAIGGAVTAGIVGYAYYRHSQNANSSSSAAGTSASSADTSGNIDPTTGYPYGSPEDTAALASQSGTTADIDPQTGYAYGSPQDEEALAALTGGGSYAGGYGGGYYAQPPTTTTVTKTVTKDMIGVPSVIGAGQTSAISAIKRAGLVPDPSITIPGDGNVTSQSPAAGTEVKKGSIVHWDAKAKKDHSKPKPHQKSFVANGTNSLRSAAQLRHVDVQTVIDDTRANRPGPRVLEYLSHGDWNKKLPRGSKWYY